MMKINEYFDDEAAVHDELFIQKLGMGEFYDAVELELNKCINRYNGDSMVANMDEEQQHRQNAEKIYKIENLPFASLHVDAPFCWLHEK
jgi:hypothetical protein